MSGELSRREWLIRGVIKGTAKAGIGYVLLVVLTGALPGWAWKLIDREDERRHAQTADRG